MNVAVHHHIVGYVQLSAKLKIPLIDSPGTEPPVKPIVKARCRNQGATHHRRAATAIVAIYFSKSRQDSSLASLTSRGGRPWALFIFNFRQRQKVNKDKTSLENPMNGKEAMRVKINSSHLSFHGYLEHRFFMYLTNHSWATQRCERLLVPENQWSGKAEKLKNGLSLSLENPMNP